LLEQEPIGRLIAATRRRIKQALGRRLRRQGLSPQQFGVLVNLDEAPGPTVRALASRLHMDEPTASRIVAGLVRRRLVCMKNDPEDRRKRCLGLTAGGSGVAEALRPVAQEVRSAVEAGFSTAEKDALRQMLIRVMDNMERLEQELAAKVVGARRES
jgi:DNA-binding MarR family transcriptional regulator